MKRTHAKALKLNLNSSRWILWLACLFLSGCQVSFVGETAGSRSSLRVAKAFYVPSATDKTSQGGFALRVTQALRRKLLNYPEIVLTSEQEATAAVDMQIEKVLWNVNSVAECDPKDENFKTTTIGSSAYRCGDLRFSVEQAEVASETEILNAVLRLQVVSLDSGKSLYLGTFPATSGAFPVVGTTTVNNNLVDRPEFHALKYAENRDLARDTVANVWAQTIASVLLNMSLAQ